ncbi:MAG: T9SS type A sorting domain-containing protein [Bacteroidales bacterium]
MKKFALILSVLVFVSLLSNSQSLSLSNSEGPISNNQVIWVAGDMNMPLAAFIYVTNNTSNDIEVLVKKEELYLVPGSINYFCWALCYPPNVYVTPDPLVIAANSTNSTNFSGDYDAGGNIGISKIRYTFFKNHFPLDTVSVEVWFNAGIVGLGEDLLPGVSFSSAFPNPASDVVKFSYSIPSVTDYSASVRIINMLGENVSETLIADNQGVLNIPVGNLIPGVYFYSFILNGKAIVTRKLVVK